MLAVVAKKLKNEKPFENILFFGRQMVEHLLEEREREESHQFCIGNESRHRFHHRRGRIKHVCRRNFGYQRPEKVRTNSRHPSFIVISVVCQRGHKNTGIKATYKTYWIPKQSQNMKKAGKSYRMTGVNVRFIKNFIHYTGRKKFSSIVMLTRFTRMVIFGFRDQMRIVP